MIWVSIHRGLKWLKACSTFSYHIERHQAKMIAAMPEARQHKSEPYVALCIKAFSNLVLFPTNTVKPWYKKPHKTITPGKRTISFAPVTVKFVKQYPDVWRNPVITNTFSQSLIRVTLCEGIQHLIRSTFSVTWRMRVKTCRLFLDTCYPCYGSWVPRFLFSDLPFSLIRK